MKREKDRQIKKKKKSIGTSLVIQWLRFCTPNAGGSSMIPHQRTRSHMPQVRVHMLLLNIPQWRLKIPHVATKTQCSKKKEKKKKPLCYKVVKWGFPGGSVVKICLPMQETWVRFLAWDDPTGWRTTEPMRHNYGGCAQEPGSCNYWPQVLELWKTVCPTAHVPNKRSPCNEKPMHHNQRVVCTCHI